ncbi:MAG: SH3 domain-containing protein [Anaerococcus sp.]|nr:SH3 domain-containing protein [Peptoniphilaceae bacterium]MDY3055686.1 SH3 domain-containing protein [Anaerococcus sp.]
MKKKNIIALMLALTFTLAGCKEEEHYESKNLPIESVFDDISSEDSKEDKEKSDKKEEDKKDEKKEDKKKTENTDENQEEESYLTQNPINIRSTPEFGDNVVEQIETGTEIKILEKNIGEDNNWAKIVYQDKVYYISMEILN